MQENQRPCLHRHAGKGCLMKGIKIEANEENEKIILSLKINEYSTREEVKGMKLGELAFYLSPAQIPNKPEVGVLLYKNSQGKTFRFIGVEPNK